jgi:hypothetical protein
MKAIILMLAGCFACMGFTSSCFGADGTTTESQKSAILEPLSSENAQSSTVPSFSNAASIEAGTSDTKGSLMFAGFVPQTAFGNYVHYELGGDAPLATKGSTDEVDIGTVSGLSAGASAHGSISAMWWPHQSDSALKVMGDICANELPKLIPGFTISEVFWLSDVDGDCSRSLFKKDLLQKIVDGLNATINQCRNLAIKTEQFDRDAADAEEVAKKDPTKGKAMQPKQPTATEDVTDKQRQLQCDALMKHPELTTTSHGKPVFDPKAKVVLQNVDNPATLTRILAEINQSDRTLSHVTLLTVGTTVNRQKDAYFNKSDLATLISDHTTGYGANITLSQIRGSALYAGGFSYEKTSKSATPTQVCSPVKGSTSLNCPSGTIGPPQETFSRILFAETRVLIKTGVFAIAPRLEYDVTASKLAAKLPLYFAPDKSKALTGGIALGYVTHGAGFGASIFVNKAFSFY